MYLGLRDETVGQALLERVFTAFGEGLDDLLQETEVDGNTWYTLDVIGYEVGITIAHSHLVVASGMGSGGVASAQAALRDASGSLLANFDPDNVALFQGDASYAGLVDGVSAIRYLISEDGLLEVLGLRPRDRRGLRRIERMLSGCIGDLTLMGGLAEDSVMGVGRLSSAREDSGFAPCITAIFSPANHPGVRPPQR